MERSARGDYPHCPHCNQRPAAGHHPCPIDLELEGCHCCGACAKLCSDIRRHIDEHTPAVFIDRGTGEVEVSYFQFDETDEDDPLRFPEWGGDGGYGETA
jgi:hypothetical protein